MNLKRLFPVSPRLLPQTFLILRRIKRDVTINVTINITINVTINVTIIVTINVTINVLRSSRKVPVFIVRF